MYPKIIRKRKISLNLENSIVVGPKRVGKSFLAFDLIKDIDGVVYINFEDYKKEFQFENAKVVIFDNYDFSIPIPNIPTIILSRKDISIDGFKKIYLNGLDFEEFFSFEKLSVNNAFDKFLRFGNFPKIFNEEYFWWEYLKESLELMDYDKDILKFFFSHIGEKLTLYQIFQIIKKEKKISKDKFYSQVEELLKDRVIFEVEKYNSPKSPKKFFSYNFAFKSILTPKKNLQYTFENIVFLELNKKLYYKDGLTFYDPKEDIGYLIMPFANEESVKAKLKKIDDIKKVCIITISNSFEIKHKKFEVEVMPFIEWRFAE